MKIRAMAAREARGPLAPFEFEPGPLGKEQVEIRVASCGICHSDLSMRNNEWGMSAYPLVPGHEIVGTVTATGAEVRGVRVGDRVGLGWYSHSCLTCRQCLSGHHNLCGSNEQTIVGRHGGFASRVRANWEWVTHLPDALDAGKAGPLFCGGITVFNPLVQFGVRPTDRVGVVGIGGLGHLAVQFLNKWGCEVYAFTSAGAKAKEALALGAHHTVDSRSDGAIAGLKGALNFILVTANVPLNWGAYIDALAPAGRLHFVGAVLEPLAIGAFPLISGQKQLSGSPLGSPATTAMMIDFCARHGIAPVTESFPMSKANEAFAHLESGRARYRVVLQNDLD
ncbi:MAG: NAD(P)-dependent alcohol dehydrogenase [Phycisphaerae bacterium]|nr:NAD(P)-dependent alcohol dehydrogenase [Phycisphaerae bacterium]